MSSWSEQKKAIITMGDDSYKWRSHRKYLREIFDQSEKWEIKPAVIERIEISNLSEIIVEAKKAIAKDDKDRLEELFEWANSKTNRELRIQLRGDRRDKIKVSEEKGKHGTIYVLKVNEKQFKRIVSATNSSYNYVIE